MKTYYFAYGSNMSFRQMRNRNIDFISSEPVTVLNYRLEFNKASKQRTHSYANIMRRLGAEVHGILYTLSAAELDKLDVFEGVTAKQYKRIEVLVYSESLNKYVEAVAYTACQTAIDETLLPTQEYLDTILESAHMLDDEYVKMLKAVQTKN